MLSLAPIKVYTCMSKLIPCDLIACRSIAQLDWGKQFFLHHVNVMNDVHIVYTSSTLMFTSILVVLLLILVLAARPGNVMVKTVAHSKLMIVETQLLREPGERNSTYRAPAASIYQEHPQ